MRPTGGMGFILAILDQLSSYGTLREPSIDCKMVSSADEQLIVNTRNVNPNNVSTNIENKANANNMDYSNANAHSANTNSDC